MGQYLIWIYMLKNLNKEFINFSSDLDSLFFLDKQVKDKQCNQNKGDK